ncbi:MAG: DNA polymerase III subunit gamma/tau [Bacilli bacterium]
MAYQALYRKYRLSSFEDMVGQDHIAKTIKNAIIQNKVSHAYLFTGPRGTGKTSIAKLVARAVNCTGDSILCGKCDNCLSILNHQISDVIEIDAASNNGVDEIRDIREKVMYTPTSCKYKVYIIDETHMLTTQAFNALLKTLEEPPSHVIFILATTEPHKIPLTILSRCQRFDFRKISESSIIERLKIIVQKESISITEESLKLIAYLSDGGMRDALSLLDQVSSYLNTQITVEDIYSITGTATKDAVEAIIIAILTKDKVSVLKKVNELSNQGKDLVKLCESLIVYIRDAMVYANGIKDDLIYESSEVFNKICSYNIDDLYEYVKFLTEILFKIKSMHNPKIYLEISLLNLLEMMKETADDLTITNLDTSALFENSGQEVSAKNILKNNGLILDVDGEIINNHNLEKDTNQSSGRQVEVAENNFVEDTQGDINSNNLELDTNQPSDRQEEVVENNFVEDMQGDINSNNLELDEGDNTPIEFEENQGEIINAGTGEETQEEITHDMKIKYYNYIRSVRINNVLVNANKKRLNDFKSKWEKLDEHYQLDEKMYLINILNGTKLRAASDEHLIICVASDMAVIKVMENIVDVEEFINNFFDVDNYKIAAVSENEWARIKDDYIKKLKSGDTYKIIDEQSINSYYNILEKRNILLQRATDYFGDDNLTVEE